MIYRQKSKKPTKKVSKTGIKMFKGLIFCILWYLSIIAGFFLLVCPFLPLVIISPRKYRRWIDIIFGMWEAFPVALMEVFMGVRVVVSGDKINPFEGSLFVMNHRTRVDWNFLWLGLFHSCQPNAHNMKYVLKAPIMHVPGPGWVMQTCFFIFIHRNWEKDKELLSTMLDYLNESDQLYQILLFPEGTDLSRENVRKSHSYAKKTGLKKYYNVLHPKTTGFTFLASKMKSGGQLKAVYDVTIAYPKTLAQNEMDLLRGKFPEEVHFHVRRYGASSIPFQEDELKDWLLCIWAEKEVRLNNFYKKGYFVEFDVEESTTEEKSSISCPPIVQTEERVEKIIILNGNVKETESMEAAQVIKESSHSFQKSNSTTSEGQRQKQLHFSEDNVVQNDRRSDDPSRERGNTSKELKSSLSSHMKLYKDYITPVDKYLCKDCRPSHLLYLVMVFWVGLILLTMHQLFYNTYLQIWVATHSLFFVLISFVSDGFHQIAASIYLYRYKKKPKSLKKKE